jgi:hypothetical protein
LFFIGLARLTSLAFQWRPTDTSDDCIRGTDILQFLFKVLLSQRTLFSCVQSVLLRKHGKAAGLSECKKGCCELPSIPQSQKQSKMSTPRTTCNTTTDNNDGLSAPALSLREAIAALSPSALNQARPASLNGSQTMPGAQAPLDRVPDDRLDLANLAIVAEATGDLENEN